MAGKRLLKGIIRGLRHKALKQTASAVDLLQKPANAIKKNTFSCRNCAHNQVSRNI